eukprot:6495313-Pyramimonas_sp.AAC.1
MRISDSFPPSRSRTLICVAVGVETGGALHAEEWSWPTKSVWMRSCSSNSLRLNASQPTKCAPDPGRPAPSRACAL